MSLPPERIVKRLDHTAATLSFIEGFYEVVLFGGNSIPYFGDSRMNDTRIIRFGKCDINEEKRSYCILDSKLRALLTSFFSQDVVYTRCRLLLRADSIELDLN